MGVAVGGSCVGVDVAAGVSVVATVGVAVGVLPSAGVSAAVGETPAVGDVPAVVAEAATSPVADPATITVPTFVDFGVRPSPASTESPPPSFPPPNTIVASAKTMSRTKAPLLPEALSVRCCGGGS